MSELVHWTGGLRPMNVTVIRTEGPGLLPGEWEAQTTDGVKVLIRESEVTPVLPTNATSPLGGAA